MEKSRKFSLGGPARWLMQNRGGPSRNFGFAKCNRKPLLVLSGKMTHYHWRPRYETILKIRSRDWSVLDQCEFGGSNKQSVSWCILQVWLAWFADRLGAAWENRSQGHLHSFKPKQLQRWSCHLLKWGRLFEREWQHFSHGLVITEMSVRHVRRLVE